VPQDRRRLASVVVSAAIALSLAPGLGAQSREHSDTASLEYEVKAAYLLNFTRFVEWPPSAFERDDSPLVICVIGQDPFHTILERTVEGGVSNGHPIRIQRAPHAADSRGCHVAFIAPVPGDPAVPAFNDAGEPPVLTVGESRGFARNGGMIGLVVVNATVRFEVNLDAIRRAGLRVSSRLVALATRVYSRQGGE
jgi:YfiR/HmsC-like